MSSGGFSGTQDNGPAPVTMIGGNLPGPPSSGISSTPSPGASNIVNGPPPDSVQVAHPDSEPIDTPSPSASPSTETTAVNMQAPPKTVATIAELDISGISLNDSYWNNSWLLPNSTYNLSPSAPSWLVQYNSTQPSTGTFETQYWNPDWQKLLKLQVLKLVRSRVDGVCLVGCSRYADFSDQNPNAYKQMIDLIASLAATAHSKNKYFIVAPEYSDQIFETLPAPNQPIAINSSADRSEMSK
jgi:uncharacterized protein (TIGR01370 family)